MERHAGHLWDTFKKMIMQLCNLKIIEKVEPVNIEVSREHIKNITSYAKNKILKTRDSIFFEDSLAFPGLINSHDHLAFNLFPQTGNRVYKNYVEWGEDIHARNKEMIRSVLKIPQQLRTEWGLYKNLLNGVTTVVNHGEILHIDNEVISVLQNNHSLHSVGFEKKWKWKLNTLFKKNWPYVIHIGEGTDKISHEEINELIKWNLFKRKIVGVHGVAMDEYQAKAFRALVWCPASNNFMLDASAPIDELKMAVTILFGTDSTLTSSWNLWDQLRTARNTLHLTDQELFDSLTKSPATIWKENNIASITANKQADIIVANSNNKTGYDAFYALNPEDIQLILHKEKILLFDEAIKNQLKAIDLSITAFSKIGINGKIKYVFGDVPALMNEILSYYPDAVFPISVL